MCHIDYQYNYTTTIQDFQWILALLLTNYYMAEYYFYFALSTNYILTALSQQFANSNSNCKFKLKICKVEIFKKVNISNTTLLAEMWKKMISWNNWFSNYCSYFRPSQLLLRCTSSWWTPTPRRPPSRMLSTTLVKL